MTCALAHHFHLGVATAFLHAGEDFGDALSQVRVQLVDHALLLLDTNVRLIDALAEDVVLG